MERDVLGYLRKVEDMRRQVELVDDCLEELDEDGELVLEILLEGGETIVRICEELGVSRATAYRRVKGVLGEIEQLFAEKQVTLS